jgi:hypothetical protein
MRLPNRVSVSCISLVPLWNQFKLIVHLAERITMQTQYVIHLSVSFITWRRGICKEQAWCEHIHCRWSAKVRCLLIASMYTEGITGISDLITLLYTTFTRRRCLVRDSPQGELRLCQK